MRIQYVVFLATLTCFLPARAPGADDATAGAQDADYTALSDMFPEGRPTLLTPQSFARNYNLPAAYKPPEKKKLPTRIEYANGPLKWDVGTNVSTHKATTSIIPTPADPNSAGAAGGSGELKGQLRYAGDDWELYGIQRFGSHQGDGVAPTFSESTTLGSLYKLPPYFAGGKIGASLEINSAEEGKARFEYRQPIGPAEGFVAAEQMLPRFMDDARQTSSLWIYVPVLATALSESRWLGSHLLVAAAGSVAVLAAAGLGFGLTALAVTGDDSYVVDLLTAALAYSPALWLTVGVAALLFGISPRLAVLAWLMPVYGFIVGYLGTLLQFPDWMVNLSPFGHIPGLPVDTMEWLPVVLLTLAGLGLAAVGMVLFRRRDLASTA